MRRVAFTQFLRWLRPAPARVWVTFEVRAAECLGIAVGAYLTSFTGDFAKKDSRKEMPGRFRPGVTLGMDRTLALRQFSMARPSPLAFLISKVLPLGKKWVRGRVWWGF